MTSPLSFARGRFGELLIARGGGVPVTRWDDTIGFRQAGLAAPSSPPTISVNTQKLYYIARVDVTKPGACYFEPPVATFSSIDSSGNNTAPRPILLDPNSPTNFAPTAAPPTPGAAPARAARTAAYLSQGAVSEIRVVDGGKGYVKQPNITLSASHGSGAELRAVLDGLPADPDPTNDPLTGITEWKVIQAPATIDDAGVTDQKAWFFALNKTYTIPAVSGSMQPGSNSVGVARTSTGLRDGAVSCTSPTFGMLEYTASGAGSGTGATFRIAFTGAEWRCTTTGILGGGTVVYSGATTVVSVKPLRFGAGYSDDEPVVVRIKSASGDATRDIILEGYTAGSSKNTTAARYSVKEIVIDKAGENYLLAPQVKITSESGFGAYATCKVDGGRIVSVTLENGGGGYKTPPKVEVLAGGAEAFAVCRPHLRGKYQCYYRFIDNTPKEKGGPLPSNLSPVREIDVGEGASSLTWAVSASGERVAGVELWRTTSNQATTLYRVRSGSGSFVDNLTDEELRDPDRAGYAAMPIVLPNGGLNANRFGVPPADKAVVVSYQDRMWFGVDTSGSEPNTLYFSEVDESESVPDVNQIILQQNVRDTDSITALIPFGGALLAMQQRHAYSLTFARQPLVDAQVTLIAYRGCLSQRCWDIHDGVAYCMDQYGVYAITPQGAVESISDSINDYFRSRIDFAKASWFQVRFDPKLLTLRCFVACLEDDSKGYPTRVLCYYPPTKTWWEERYPQRLSGSAACRLSNGEQRVVYGGQGGVYMLGAGPSDEARGSVSTVSISARGLGYRTPPAVRATGGCGAEFEASVDAEGRLTGIWVKNPGYGYSAGELYIGPPNDPTCLAPQQARASFAVIENGPSAIHYLYRSGNMEYVNDSQDPKAASQSSRHIGLTYAPQPESCVVSLRTFYNNSQYPRANVSVRDRATGFAHSSTEPAARLDMSEVTRAYGQVTGVARALYAGRTQDDVRGADRHVAVELAGVRATSAPVVFYACDVYGTAGGGE